MSTSPQQLPRIERLWKHYFPSLPFSYYFIAENFDAQYAADRLTLLLFNISTALALFVCIIGLYGLVSLTTTRANPVNSLR